MYRVMTLYNVIYNVYYSSLDLHHLNSKTSVGDQDTCQASVYTSSFPSQTVYKDESTISAVGCAIPVF